MCVGRYLGRGGGHSTRPGNGAAGAGGCARTGGGATTEQDRGGEKAQDAWAPTRFRGAGPCQGVRVGARKTGGRRVRAVPRAQRPGFGAESLFPRGEPQGVGCAPSPGPQGLPGASCPHLRVGPGLTGRGETPKVLECGHVETPVAICWGASIFYLHPYPPPGGL